MKSERFLGAYILLFFLFVAIFLQTNHAEARVSPVNPEFDLNRGTHFTYDTNKNISNLLQTISTPALLADIYPGQLSSLPLEITEISGKLFFTATDNEGSNLWEYDPAQPVDASNPQMVVDINTSYGVYPRQQYLTPLMGKLYFAFEGKMWVYDSQLDVSEENPKIIEAYEAGSTFERYWPVDLKVIDNKIYFTNAECSGTRRFAIWEYDPTMPNVIGINPHKIIDMYNDHCSNIGAPVQLNGKLYFTAHHTQYGNEIWVYDPTKENEYLINPKLLFEIIPGHQDDFVNDLSVLESKLVFNADDGINGRELWIFDPAVEIGNGNPKMVADINPGDADGWPSILDVVLGKLLMIADDGQHGFEYWLYDPNQPASTNNPKMIWDFMPGTESGSTYRVSSVFDGKIYLGANDGQSGIELWVYDFNQPVGDTNPQLIMDINPGYGDSSPDSMFIYKGKMYFQADDGVIGSELWEFDLSECFALYTSHTGSGNSIVASPSKSTLCPAIGNYLEGDVITVTASPDPGWEVGSWRGTSNDSSKSFENTLTMPASDHTVIVNYQVEPALPTGSFISPVNGGTVMKPRAILSVNVNDSVAGIESVTFFAHYDGERHLIGQGIQEGFVWRYQWGTYNIPDQTFSLEAVIEDSFGKTNPIYLSNLKFTNTITLGNGYESRSGGGENADTLTPSPAYVGQIPRDPKFQGPANFDRRILMQ